MHDTIILAGGQGNRMGGELPKPLVEVRGKPIICHQIDYFLSHVPRLIISLGHRAQEVEQAIRQYYNYFPMVAAPFPAVGGSAFGGMGARA